MGEGAHPRQVVQSAGAPDGDIMFCFLTPPFHVLVDSSQFFVLLYWEKNGWTETSLRFLWFWSISKLPIVYNVMDLSFAVSMEFSWLRRQLNIPLLLAHQIKLQYQAHLSHQLSVTLKPSMLCCLTYKSEWVQQKFFLKGGRSSPCPYRQWCYWSG